MKKMFALGVVCLSGLGAQAALASGELQQSYQIQVEAAVAPQEQRQPLPYYDENLRQTGLQGQVVVRGVIGTDGHVRDVRLVSGHPLLGRAARQAVSRWRYEPARLKGQAVAMDLTVNVDFSLDRGKPASDQVAAVSVVTPLTTTASR